MDYKRPSLIIILSEISIEELSVLIEVVVFHSLVYNYYSLLSQLGILFKAEKLHILIFVTSTFTYIDKC
jgi:hypothetical protein